MSDLFWLSEAKVERLRPFFPKSSGRPRVDDRRVPSGYQGGKGWRCEKHERRSVNEKSSNQDQMMNSSFSEGEYPQRLSVGPRNFSEKAASFRLKLEKPFFFFLDIEVFSLSERVILICYLKEGEPKFYTIEKTVKRLFRVRNADEANHMYFYHDPAFRVALDHTGAHREFEWFRVGGLIARWENGKSKFVLCRVDDRFSLTLAEACSLKSVLFQ